MIARALAAAVLLAALLAAPSPVAADPGSAAVLREADAALAAGDPRRAAELAGPLTSAAGVDRADRSQAWRVYGLALLQGGRAAEAEAALLEHLKLEPGAHLDPARFPPEVIVFFEDVRSRHAAELAAERDARPQTVREKAKNLFPPWGQIQNGQRAKAISLGAAEVLLLAANITSAVLLYRWCDQSTQVCKSGSDSRHQAAIRMRQLNIAALVGLVGVYAYGVIDGFYHHGDRRTERSYMSLGVEPSAGGAALVVGGRF